MKKVFLTICLLIVPLVVTSQVSAAAPDGAGPWADSVFAVSQGLMKNGSPVPVIRSDPNSALGVAENNTTDGNFFSLGFGGVLSLGFDNGISSGVIVVEATNPGYPAEKIKVEVSENGTTWVNAGEITQDGSVNKPASVTCAKYVRLTDISNPDDFGDATADAYDVDGVQASGDPCTPPAGNDGGCCGCTNVSQSNKTVSNTTVNVTGKTGNNKVNNNVGGTNTITTGDITNTVQVAVSGGNNTVNSGQCCEGGNTNVTITGNGAGSTNTVTIKSGKQSQQSLQTLKAKKK